MLTTSVQLLRMAILGKNASTLSLPRAYIRCSHGGLSAVMKLTKMFAENVSMFSERLEAY